MKKYEENNHFSFSMFKVLTIILIIGVILANLVLSINAQQPFQDAKGEGSLFVTSGGFIQVNISDPTIRFGYLRDVSKNRWSYGFDLSGKPSGSTAAIIKNGNVVPEAKINFSIGRKHLFTKEFDPQSIIVDKLFVLQLQKVLAEKNLLVVGKRLPIPTGKVTLLNYLTDLRDKCIANPIDCVVIGNNFTSVFETTKLKDYRQFDRLLFQGGYAFKEYSLYDASLPFDNQVYKKKFHSPKAQLIYTRMIKGNSQVGVSVGIEKSNNSDELTEIEVRDFATTTSGTNTREAGKTKKALRGNFTQSTRSFVNTDFIIFPEQLNHRIGLNFFTRSGLSGNNKGFKPGFGLFLSKEGEPTQVIGGISVLLDKGKPRVALTAGFNF